MEKADVGGGDPPDEPDVIDAPADNVITDDPNAKAAPTEAIMTPIGDTGMHINFDFSSLPAPPDFCSSANSSTHVGSKRKRISSDGNDDAICSSVDENVLPLVDSGICVKCEERCNVHEVLACCSCNKLFHGTCEQIPKSTRNNPTVPAQSHVVYYNKNLMRGEGLYSGGRFSWMCASCITLNEIGNKKYYYDRVALLESAVIQNTIHHAAAMKQMQDAIQLLTAQVNKLGSVENSSSGVVKHPVANPTQLIPVSPISGQQVVPQTLGSTLQLDFAKVVNKNIQSGNSIVPTTKTVRNTTSSAPPVGNVQRTLPRSMHTKYNFRLKIVDKDQKIPIMNTLRKLADENKLKGYDNYRSKGKYAIELLFSTGEEVSSAFTELNEVFKNDTSIDVLDPDIINPSRTYFVGLSETDTVASAISKLSRRYPDLDLKGSNRWALKMYDPKPCIKDKSTYRATVFLTKDLHEYISDNFNNRFRLGNFESWSVYSYISRCVKCQSFEHSLDSCNQPDPVCAKCAGKHFTSKCNAKEEDLCCCNCKRSTEFNSGYKSHCADSSECPVYIRAKRSKN